MYTVIQTVIQYAHDRLYKKVYGAHFNFQI